ncbi:sensor domain-containing diguanylate cyclase [Tautonia sp. JC769]|uniref:sensor domain-containing diguanylate cyclase n=1 Tax=Tautonia sp. JC769 TaxID=3232135 RepID=UPI0034597995
MDSPSEAKSVEHRGVPGVDPVVDPARLDALRKTHLLDGPPEIAFDRLTHLAQRILHAPVALISLVDDRRQFFKSAQGLPEPWASRRETPLSHSFCQHVVRSAGPLVIQDARIHPLVHQNLAIRDLGVIAYLGAPLATSAGQVLGAFCVIDGKPRHWGSDDLEVVREMATSTMTEVELRLDVERRQEVERLLALQLQRAEELNQALQAQSAELAAANSLLEALARTDGLTGLWNIRAMRTALEDRASFCLRQGLPMSLIMLDLDRFKLYNDTHGHPAGDEVLMAVSDTIREEIRSHDLAGRYGGEEFIIGLPGSDAPEALAVAERLREAIASRPWPIEPVTASLGIATFDRPIDIPALIRAADSALYHAKRSGRNCARFDPQTVLTLAIEPSPACP